MEWSCLYFIPLIVPIGASNRWANCCLRIMSRVVLCLWQGVHISTTSCDLWSFIRGGKCLFNNIKYIRISSRIYLFDIGKYIRISSRICLFNSVKYIRISSRICLFNNVKYIRISSRICLFNNVKYIRISSRICLFNNATVLLTFYIRVVRQFCVWRSWHSHRQHRCSSSPGCSSSSQRSVDPSVQTAALLSGDRHSLSL
jgi:hypothetical protein